MKGILEGVRVLDISRYLAGPFCCAILADMGAEVIRIEEPGGAECGQMAYTGFPGDPPIRAAVGWCDLGTGLHAALGTVSALLHRQKTGRGRMVETSLFDTAASLMTFPGGAARYKVLGEVMPKVGNETLNYFGDMFKTKDGWGYIMVIGNPMWERRRSSYHRVSAGQPIFVRQAISLLSLGGGSRRGHTGRGGPDTVPRPAIRHAHDRIQLCPRLRPLVAGAWRGSPAPAPMSWA